MGDGFECAYLVDKIHANEGSFGDDSRQLRLSQMIVNTTKDLQNTIPICLQGLGKRKLLQIPRF